ncbi:unnamed protein product [Chrysoparadoxa australica]
MNQALTHIRGSLEASSLNDKLTKLHQQLVDVAQSFYAEMKANPRADAHCSLLEQCANLSPADHTLGIVHLLDAQIVQLHEVDEQMFLDFMAAFLGSPGLNKDHIKVCAKKFLAVCQRYSALSIAQNRAAGATMPLMGAAAAMAPTPATLTPVHACMLHCCIMAKCYGVAVDYLDHNSMFEILPKAAGLTAPNYLLYFYYAGVAYIGKRRWADAMASLMIAITTPANAISAIVLEALKKLTLVGLIHNGEPPELPKYTPSILRRSTKVLDGMVPYNNLVTVYKGGSREAMDVFISENTGMFTADGNLGLVKQVAAQLTLSKIVQLTKTYITLPLQDVAQAAGLSGSLEAEQYLRQLIQSGTIVASIDLLRQTVRFSELTRGVNIPSMMHQLQHDLAVTMDLSDRVRTLDTAVSTSAQFINKVNQLVTYTPRLPISVLQGCRIEGEAPSSSTTISLVPI